MLVRQSRSAFITTLLAVLSFTGCSQGYEDLAGGVSVASVATGTHEQAIDGPFEFDVEWTTVRFERPLVVDESAIQVFGIALNPRHYRPRTLADDERGGAQESLSEQTPFGIKAWLPERVKDGKVIYPEVELITAEGERVRVGVNGITHFGRGSYSPVSYNFGVLPKAGRGSRDDQARFPVEHRYRAVRVRTNEPLEAYFLAWYKMPEDPRSGQ